MIELKLPDGQARQFSEPVDGRQVAASISKSLEKNAIAWRVNNELKDLSYRVSFSASIQILTRDSEEGLEILRHDAAHILAQAVKELFPETQVTIGPVIATGFYYDFYREKPFNEEDLVKIELRMHEIVDRSEAISREVWDRQKAIRFFQDIGEAFKAEIIESIPSGEEVSLYRQGNFIDLCRGPHAPSTKHLGHAFKLMKVAGAYWRGDSNNPMLQRIYGTAWASEKDLENYLTLLEEAEKRDHRRLGKQMGLFHLQEEAAGSVFWHPKGWVLYRTLENYLRHLLNEAGYLEIRTPQLYDKSLWELSGHWEVFRENMFTVEDEHKTLAIKPMSCPGHVQVFKQGTKSYRDLPLRFSEFGSCHRCEPSGALHGIMRVRAFVQDDAHIFCTPEQITDETKAFCDLLHRVYKDLGFQSLSVKFSDRPEKRAGEEKIWDEAEDALKKGAEAANLSWELNPGEGAFYGPKLEFVLKDALGREWQCGTLQADFVLPERLDAYYIGEDGAKHRPVMLHRAIFGSFERFIGILIEHYAGHFPLWLTPIQIKLTTITSECDAYAKEVYELMQAKGLRCEIDVRNEKISYKIREASHLKIPIICVIGKKEVETRSLAIRRLGQNEQNIVNLEEALEDFLEEARIPSFRNFTMSAGIITEKE